MERPILKPIGTPVEELDTPALVVDLDQFCRNVDRVHSYFVDRTAKIRPFVSVHRCPALAHLQLASPGHAGGVAVGTVGQAEVFVDAGISDIMITGKAVTPNKINAICALATRSTVSIAVDSIRNLAAISAAADQAGVEVSVLIELESGLGTTGVGDVGEVVTLARMAVEAHGVHLKGLTSYAGSMPPDGETSVGVDLVLKARRAMEEAGLACPTVAVGSSADYEAAGNLPGVTEVVAGNYALGDARYEEIRDDIQPSAMVLGTVVSTPEEQLVVGDAGMKTNGNDTGLPRVASVPGAQVIYLSAEHFNLDLSKAEGTLKVGDKVWFVPHDIGVTANHFDYIMAARDGKLTAVLDVTARGRYR